MAEVNTNATAEPDVKTTNPTTQSTEPKATPEPKAEPQKKEPTVQELMVELAKYRRSSEKNASEAAEWKKKYTASLSEKEQADMAKAEAEAKREDEFKQLQRKVKINDLTTQFMKLGYGDSAEKAAIAQADNDTDALFKIQAEVDAAKRKAWESEFLKNRPQPQVGVSNGESAPITKEEFAKLGYMGQLQFKNQYPETYKEYTKR